MPITLSDGTVIEHGYICSRCRREFSETSLNRHPPSGSMLIGGLPVCHLCVAKSDRPWMTALEMQFQAMRIVGADGPRGTGLSRRDREYLRSAETYGWSADTVRAVSLASRSIPRDSRLILPLLPTGQRFGWWWFDTPIATLNDAMDIEKFCQRYKLDVPVTDGPRVPVSVSAILFGLEDSGVKNNDTVYFRTFATLSPDLIKKAGGPIGSWLSWSVGVDETLDDLVERGKTQVKEEHYASTLSIVSAVTRFFMAGCAWLQQRVVTMSIGHVERHRRKQLAREIDGGPEVSDVKVIQLRRSETYSRPSDVSGIDVDWSCRWIVNGHWRNQPYKNDERKLIYIMPYVKGPDDKPLKVPKQTVYAVTR